MSFHSLSIDQSLKTLESTESGLNHTQVQQRQLKHGFNELVQSKKKTILALFAEQFNNFMVIILVLAALVSAFAEYYAAIAAGEPIVVNLFIDAIAILAIVVLNAFFGLWQEFKADKAVEALKKLVAPNARVFRDGKEHVIASRQLVPGDIILVEAGDQVPADSRLIESLGLKVNEASLTGESMPSAKKADLVLEEKLVLNDWENMVFSGTIVTSGRGKAVVCQTGMSTQMGKIATQVSEVEEEPTPLQVKLDALGKKLGYAALAICLLVFIVGYLRGQALLEMFLVSVSLAVAAIPEGLPAIVTLTLAIGVQQMAKRNAIVKKLKSVETLGSATVVCSDKTGTLTKNEMTVRELFFDNRFVQVTGAGYAVTGDFLEEGNAVDLTKDVVFEKLMQSSVLCNSAFIDVEGKQVSQVGDPTEVALLVCGKKAGFDSQALEKNFKPVFELSFDSERKMMSTVHELDSRNKIVFVKGAPEQVLAKSNRVFSGGKEKSITEADKKRFLSANQELAQKALRVLAVAFKKIPSNSKNFDEKNLESELVFIGLLGMIDPPRPEVKLAIQTAYLAGVRTIMITGDNPLTAKAISDELGLISDGEVVTGIELEDASDVQLNQMVSSTNVFARVSPTHKLLIIDALKKQGHVVAMTGDGVNDAPALKKADIGIAMAITGTDVSKEASDIVLADDNFASIINAIEEGRRIYDNIAKSVRFLVSCNIAEVLVVFLGILFGWPLVLIPVQILWMNLVTDAVPALALGSEKAEPDIMRRKPTKSSDNILGGKSLLFTLLASLIMTVGVLGVFYLNLGNAVKAQTMAFTTIILFQLFHSLNMRSLKHSFFEMGVFSNKLLWAGFLIALGLQVFIVQTPFLDAIFGTTPLSLADWLLAISVSASVFVAFEAVKLVLKKRMASAQVA